MKTIKIACLLLLLSFAMASEFVPYALTHNSPGVFGYTDIGTPTRLTLAPVSFFKSAKPTAASHQSSSMARNTNPPPTGFLRLLPDSALQQR